MFGEYPIGDTVRIPSLDELKEELIAYVTQRHGFDPRVHTPYFTVLGDSFSTLPLLSENDHLWTYLVSHIRRTPAENATLWLTIYWYVTEDAIREDSNHGDEDAIVRRFLARGEERGHWFEETPDPLYPIIAAISEGTIEDVLVIYRRWPRVNIPGIDTRPETSKFILMIRYASLRGDPEMVRFLLTQFSLVTRLVYVGDWMEFKHELLYLVSVLPTYDDLRKRYEDILASFERPVA